MKYLAAVLMLLSGSYARAATYWVSPTGAAAWTSCSGTTPRGDNSACSVATADANAQAGDTVYFRGGTYNVGSDPGDGYHGAVEPAHSGTAQKQLVFTAYSGEAPILNGTPNVGYEAMVVLGGGDGSLSYVTYNGFTVEANGGAMLGNIHIGGSTPGSNGWVVTNNTVLGGSNVTAEDNRDAIRVDETSNAIITNNTVIGPWGPSGVSGCSGNYSIDWAGIKIYNSNFVTISHNDISSTCSGISYKRFSTDNTISNNYIHNTQMGIHVNVTTGYNGNDYARINIHDNVFNMPIGAISTVISLEANDTTAYVDDPQIYNNTVRQPDSGGKGCISAGSTNRLIMFNNICVASNNGDSGIFTTSLINSIAEEDYDQWGTYPFRIQTCRYCSGGANTYTSLASWQSSGQLISGGSPGTGDLASDPLFVNNVSGHFASLGDFALCVQGKNNCAATSPSKGTGKGGVDMGAQICAVGPNASCSGSTASAPPAAPRGFTLR